MLKIKRVLSTGSQSSQSDSFLYIFSIFWFTYIPCLRTASTLSVKRTICFLIPCLPGSSPPPLRAYNLNSTLSGLFLRPKYQLYCCFFFVFLFNIVRYKEDWRIMRFTEYVNTDFRVINYFSCFIKACIFEMCFVLNFFTCVVCISGLRMHIMRTICRVCTLLRSISPADISSRRGQIVRERDYRPEFAIFWSSRPEYKFCADFNAQILEYTRNVTKEFNPWHLKSLPPERNSLRVKSFKIHKKTRERNYVSVFRGACQMANWRAWHTYTLQVLQPPPPKTHGAVSSMRVFCRCAWIPLWQTWAAAVAAALSFSSNSRQRSLINYFDDARLEVEGTRGAFLCSIAIIKTACRPCSMNA